MVIFGLSVQGDGVVESGPSGAGDGGDEALLDEELESGASVLGLAGDALADVPAGALVVLLDVAADGLHGPGGAEGAVVVLGGFLAGD